MFDRKLYKTVARKQLEGRWFTPILATVFHSAIFYAIFIFYRNKLLVQGIETWLDTLKINSLESVKMPFSFYVMYIIIFGIFSIANSYLYVTLSHTKEKQPFSIYINGFSLWLKGIFATLWSYLWICLWSLLLIIPGIIKAISYSQIFFIIAEYPDISIRKAMNLSKTITKGYKAKLFVMYLSFVGWILLTAITCGILSVWLLPYMSMSFVNAYHALKDNALKSGTISLQDFEITDSATVANNTSTTTLESESSKLETDYTESVSNDIESTDSISTDLESKASESKSSETSELESIDSNSTTEEQNI